MQCVHCRAWNEEDERRCVRCGRRMHAPAPRPAADLHPLMEATAPALETFPGGRALHEEASVAAASAAALGGYQPSLFREPSNGRKVVPIPTLTPRPHGVERKPRASGTQRP